MKALVAGLSLASVFVWQTGAIASDRAAWPSSWVQVMQGVEKIRSLLQFQREREAARVLLDEEKAWITTLEQNGALMNTPPDGKGNKSLTPYFAAHAAMGLATDEKYLPDVKNFLQWYLNHLNRPDKTGLSGTVYDYQITPSGEEISKNSYDSADSYSATTISLLRQYYDRSGDASFLLTHRDNIALVASVMPAMMDTDHLTWAKPDYPVKYLMDNCEVFKGLQDMAYLYRHVYHDAQKAREYQIYADQSRQAILTELRHGDEFYTYKGAGGGKKVPDLHVWYPDSTSQLYPIVYGVIAPTDPLAQKLYATFNRYNPDWAKLPKNDRFPWAIIGYVASVMQDWPRVETYQQAVQDKFLTTHHWPWYSSEAAWFTLMLHERVSNSNIYLPNPK